MNTKKRIIDGLFRKWKRKGGDPKLFPIYVQRWMSRLTAVNRRKLHRLMSLQDCSCFYCRRTMSTDAGIRKTHRATIDHKVLQSKGGTCSMSNIVAACSECNGLRGDMEFERFEAMMREHGFYETRKLILNGRNRLKESNKAQKVGNVARRRRNAIFQLAYLMFILDRLEKPWYPASIIDAQRAAKEAMRRDRAFEPA